MKVINLASWAGLHFSLAHGTLVDIPEGIARERITAGVARVPTAEELESLAVTVFPGSLAVEAGKEQPVEAPRQKGKRR